MDIEFVDELPHTRADKGAYADFAMVLRDNPGKWALYPFPISADSARGFAYQVNKGQSAAFRSGFEAATRQGALYMRYIEVDK